MAEPTEHIALVEAVGGNNCAVSVPLVGSERRVFEVRRTGNAQVGLARCVHDARICGVYVYSGTGCVGERGAALRARRGRVAVSLWVVLEVVSWQAAAGVMIEGAGWRRLCERTVRRYKGGVWCAHGGCPR